MFYIISLKLYVTILLGLVAVIGDYIVLHSKIHIFQAVFDNATHAIIAGLSWFLVCICCRKYNYTGLIEVAISAICASLIDLDHFIVARSFHLEVQKLTIYHEFIIFNFFQDAVKIEGRPLLHCSTFPLLFGVFLLLLHRVIQHNLILNSSLIILTVFVSHHTRDATRRGYWFYPLGSTPPLPYTIYVIITCIFPFLIVILYNCSISNNAIDSLV